MKNVLEYLEASASRFPDMVGFTDNDREVTFAQLKEISERIGSSLKAIVSDSFFRSSGKPVAILIDRNVKCIEAMFGAVYAGGFYAVIDVNSPIQRIKSILKTLQPEAIITDASFLSLAEKVCGQASIILYEDSIKNEIDKDFLQSVRSKSIDTDPLYVLFTSGSSGTPKGAVLSHKSVISYTEWVSNQFGFSEKTAFGSQTPLYFSMSVTDLFSTIKCGSSYNIIPKSYFSFPVKLMEYLNEKKINTLYWVPSALAIFSNWDVFKYEKPLYLEKVLFAGEVMPAKHLNYWRSNLPKCLYANLFGPTETTDICTFYVVDRDFSDDESIPIGKPCSNCDAFLVNDKEEAAAPGESGELLVRGSFLAEGYYNDAEKTAAAFTQNPLNTAYPERVYRTGDLVKLNEYGEYIYLCRKDFQIKRMGYRIEPGEIEAAASSLSTIKSAAVIYDESSDNIVLYYEGKADSAKDIKKDLKSMLPSYMHPDDVLNIKSMPYNANGKTDRIKLKELYTDYRKERN